VALLAALLASGATYGVGQLGDDGATAAGAGTTSSAVSAPVIQATGSSPDWTATAKAVSPSVVAIKVTNGQSGGQGSGVIIDTNGHVVTNNHVATAGGSDARITVTLNDNRTYRATVVGTDPSTDLAVLQITDPPGGLSPISLGDSSKLSVGEPVMAVGNPLGLAGTVTTGIVSALDRPVTTQGESSPLGQSSQPVVTNAIQTSAAINPGNSGGALVDESGQLIGINSSIATLGSGIGGGQSGNIGIGFAIPVNEVRSIADQLITNGKAEHAYLGVAGQDTTVQLGSARRSASEIRVLADTPAAKAGLKTGDAVISIDGDSVDSWLSLVAQVHERAPGDKATVTVVRDGERKDVSVTFGTSNK
jgi:putative serine protease PepD